MAVIAFFFPLSPLTRFFELCSLLLFLSSLPFSSAEQRLRRAALGVMGTASARALVLLSSPFFDALSSLSSAFLPLHPLLLLLALWKASALCTARRVRKACYTHHARPAFLLRLVIAHNELPPVINAPPMMSPPNLLGRWTMSASSYKSGTRLARSGMKHAAPHLSRRRPQLPWLTQSNHPTRFRSMAPMYYRNASAAMLVYDVTNSKSFEEIRGWVTELQSNTDEGTCTAVVATSAGTHVSSMKPVSTALPLFVSQ